MCIYTLEAETKLSAVILFWIAWRIVQHSSAIIKKNHNISALTSKLSQHGDGITVCQYIRKQGNLHYFFEKVTHVLL